VAGVTSTLKFLLYSTRQAGRAGVFTSGFAGAATEGGINSLILVLGGRAHGESNPKDKKGNTTRY
jgi:hypothetical protein